MIASALAELRKCTCAPFAAKQRIYRAGMAMSDYFHPLMSVYLPFSAANVVVNIKYIKHFRQKSCLH